MSTPLIVLASILAFVALILIPFMFVKEGRQQKREQQHVHGKERKNTRKKKKR